MAFDLKLFNVVMLGMCFMLIFTAFQTTANVQTDVLNQVVRDGHKTLKGKGYTSAAIIYAVFSLSNFLAPPIVSTVGPRASMMIGGFCYCIFIGNLIYPLVSTLFVASVIVGFGAAIIWTAQGNFLTINSNDETMGRNSGIFWALLQCSLLFGNMFVYFYFKGKVNIDQTTQETLFSVLTVCCVLGTLLLVILRKPPHLYPTLLNNEEEEREVKQLPASPSGLRKEFGVGPKLTPLQSFYRSFQLLRMKEMLLLCVTIAYTGLELAFFSGVYGTSVGNTIKLDDRKRQIGLVGMLIGAGEITGGLAFGIFGKKTIRGGRDPIVLFGFLVHLVTFYLIFLNLPDRAPIEETVGYSYLHYNLGVVGLCGFLLGLGDSSFNTQLYSCLGTLFPNDSAPAFALFKCVQSVAAAIGFGYSIATPLKWQLFILCIFGFAGTLSFFAVERIGKGIRRDGYTAIPES